MPSAVPYVWATDLELNEANPSRRAAFLEQVRILRPRRVLLGGGVSDAAHLRHHLTAIADAARCPVSFVLAPSDYVGSTLAKVRSAISVACREDARLDWLAFGHVVRLDAGRALVGHGGWGDAGALSEDIPIPSFPLRVGLENIELDTWPGPLLRPRIHALGADSVDRLRSPLHQAAARFREVVVLTHIPPVRAMVPLDAPPARLAHGVCHGLGELLLEAAEQWPDTRFVVLCGNTTTSTTLELRPNLRIESSGLVGRPGVIRRLHWWPQEERPPRPADGDGPAPVRPVEEAATVALNPAALARIQHRSDDWDRALFALRGIAARPVSTAYPFTHGESAEDWTAEFRKAVAELSDDDRLADVDHGGIALVRWLLHLCFGPISPELERDVSRVRIVGDMVRNIVFPDRINQGQKGTCAVTCVEVWLASRHPAEYARVVAGLVRPEGRVLLYNGEPMTRDEEAFAWTETEGERSPTSRLFQVAGMEYADPDTDYCNASDTHYELDTAGVAIPAGTGLALSAFDRLLEGLTGELWRVLTDQDGKIAAALEALGLPTDGRLRIDRDAESIIARALAQDDAVFVTLAPRNRESSDPTTAHRTGESIVALPHKVRVTELDRAGNRVFFDDPYDPTEPWIPDVQTTLHDHFGRCSMGWDDFFSLVVEMSFRPVHARSTAGPTP